ncbi:hypothetical protein HMI55_007250 [Coelomomyces lativittatus]|nr:hypothetical protein HMI56_000402 [Coelomomyces lativittatus]KAJ1509797.1 hypothetical protein HMI55_007250 [Coelomomyces lativittatus]
MENEELRCSVENLRNESTQAALVLKQFALLHHLHLLQQRVDQLRQDKNTLELHFKKIWGWSPPSLTTSIGNPDFNPLKESCSNQSSPLF